MASSAKYELGLNWAGSGPRQFVDRVLSEARYHRLNVLCVALKDRARIRRRVERGDVSIGVFLNTQADGANFESPGMLLCRSLKASGTLVIEDPDDSKIYADRSVQFDYLARGGLSVPKHFVINDWRPSKRALPARDQAQLGETWMALPARGMDLNKRLVSSSRNISSTLARGGYRAGQKIVIRGYHKPRASRRAEAWYRVWHLFDHVIICRHDSGAQRFEPIGDGEFGSDLVSALTSTVRRIGQITGLDWFMSEILTRGPGKSRELLILEPANALAGLGPGTRIPGQLPPAVTRLAAEVVVDVAWRKSRGMPLSDGTSIRLRLPDG